MGHDVTLCSPLPKARFLALSLPLGNIILKGEGGEKKQETSQEKVFSVASQISLVVRAANSAADITCAHIAGERGGISSK